MAEDSGEEETMKSGKTSGLMVCVLVLVAVIVSGYAGETSIKAWAVWQGQGRFYKATDNLALFSGYFEGLMEVENKQGVLDAASMRPHWTPSMTPKRLLPMVANAR